MRATSAQLDLAAGDARDVEQVVDEARELAHLAVDHVVGPLQARRGGGLGAQDLDRVAHRSERIAQLVGEDREELVLAAVGLLQCLGELRILDRHRAQVLLGALALVDVGAVAVPLHHAAGFVVHGRHADQEPAIDAVVAADARLELEAVAVGDRLAPRLGAPWIVLGVHRVARPLRDTPRGIEAGVFEHAVVGVGDLTAGIRGPREGGRGLDQAAKTILVAG
jgi:hypothetical protein